MRAEWIAQPTGRLLVSTNDILTRQNSPAATSPIARQIAAATKRSQASECVLTRCVAGILTPDDRVPDDTRMWHVSAFAAIIAGHHKTEFLEVESGLGDTAFA
ncbi:hypothetical protein MINTM001_04030 [Mycobacterium paraintracellulare]|nr:hypothetical protein MINTM001_04030 [Mycobacterium paraintracellulare]